MQSEGIDHPTSSSRGLHLNQLSYSAMEIKRNVWNLNSKSSREKIFSGENMNMSKISIIGT
jgi:hypothetical protein